MKEYSKYVASAYLATITLMMMTQAIHSGHSEARNGEILIAHQ